MNHKIRMQNRRGWDQRGWDPVDHNGGVAQQKAARNARLHRYHQKREALARLRRSSEKVAAAFRDVGEAAAIAASEMSAFAARQQAAVKRRRIERFGFDIVEVDNKFGGTTFAPRKP